MSIMVNPFKCGLLLVLITLPLGTALGAQKLDAFEPTPLVSFFFYKTHPSLQNLDADELYFWGWSEKDLVAWGYFKSSSGAEPESGREFILMVQDLESDRIRFMERQKVGAQEGIEELWNLHGQRWSEVFHALKVQPWALQLVYFPFVSGGDLMEAQWRGIPWGENGLFQGYDLILKSSRQGQKPLVSLRGRRILQGGVVGFLHKPGSTRIAVMTWEQPQGWYGNEGPLSFRVSGGALRGGYQR